MIEFTCFYCGWPIRAAEDLLHKQVNCPACGHMIAVWQRRLDASTPPPHLDKREKKDASLWADKSDQEIAACLLRRAMPRKEPQRRVTKIVFSPLWPRGDDLTLFALSLSFTLLGSINADLRQNLGVAFTAAWTRDMDWLIAPMILTTVGMVLSLVNVFLRREKSGLERFAQLLFAMVVTAGTGLYAGWIVLQQNHHRLLMIFPACNIIQAGLLLVLSRLGGANSECVTDEHAGYAQVVLTALCVPVLLAVCQSFELHWAITYSIAVTYTMSLHNGLRDVLGRSRPAPETDLGP